MSARINFETPAVVTDLDLAFGGRMSELLPGWAAIPSEFKRSHGTTFNKVVSQWFFGGLPKETTFTPKQGIDPKAAMRHVAAVLSSWEPKHEHKEAGAAYLLSLWFERIELPVGSAT